MAYRFAPFPDRGEIAFLQHRDAGDTIRAAIAFFRRNAKPLLMALFGIAGPVALALSIAVASLMSRVPGAFPMSDPFEGMESLESVDWSGLWPSILMVVLGALVLTYVGPLVGYGFVRLYRQGDVDKASISGVWDAIRPLFWPVFSVAFLQLAVFFLLMLLIVIPLLGWIAFFGLFVYVYPVFTVTFVARVFETDSALSAFERARELVRGKWAYAAGVVLIASLIGFAVTMIAGLPAAMWNGVVESLYGTTRPTLFIVSMAAGQVLQLLGSLLGSLLVAIAACFLFGSLKEDQEGSSLVGDLEIFASSDSTDEEPARPEEKASDFSGSPSQPDDNDSSTSEQGGFRGGGFHG